MILADFNARQLLQQHDAIEDELRARGVTRSGNNPLCDLAESLFCKAFGWDQAPRSEPGADAISNEGVRYQIKSRRLRSPTSSRQVGALRNLDGGPFDFLAGVLFAKDYSIYRAALIPIQVVRDASGFQKHTNSAIFHLRDSLWSISGVVDTTDRVRSVWDAWDARQ